MSRRLAFIAAFVLIAVVYVTYQSSFRIGFYLDDYYHIERAGRIEQADALRQIFDPRVQTLWYRPLQGLQFFFEYQLFGGNSNAYHFVSITYHALNVLMIYAIAWRISKKWLSGFLAALFYATFTVYISGVNWIGIVEPLLGIFYLTSFWFWWAFLESGRRRDYCFSLSAFVLALMCKQTALTIPVLFFLADRLLVRNPISRVDLFRRYLPFVIGTAFFSFLQYIAPSTSTFTGWFGWKLGLAMASILWEYFVLLFFPWGLFPSIDLNPVTVGTSPTYIWAAIALTALFSVAWLKRSRWCLFLAAFSLFTLVPVLPFPFLEHRYLYLPIISIAVLLSFIVERAFYFLKRTAAVTPVASMCIAFIAFGNGWMLNDSVSAAADWARTLRVPFRDIERQNPTFPRDTLLYFIDPITPTEGGLSGMFFLRYGKDIHVLNWTQYAGLRDHNVAYVYYFDDLRRPQKIEVEKNAAPTTSQPVPIKFQSHLRLDGYELARTTIQRGTPLVLILYWRALEQVDRDYSVFLHLIDRNGRIVVQSDSQPRKGQAPTSGWARQLTVIDVVMLPVDMDVQPGSGYRLIVGLYDPRTGTRLQALDANSQPISDSVVIEKLWIAE